MDQKKSLLDGQFKCDMSLEVVIKREVVNYISIHLGENKIKIPLLKKKKLGKIYVQHI